MSETLPDIKINNFAAKAEEVLPKLKKGHDLAVAAMKAITGVTTPEERRDVEQLCIRVRDTYTKMKGMRVEVTGELDDFKKFIMDFERPLSDTDKNSDYNRLRSYITAYDQAEIDRKKKVEQDAQKKKDRENNLVDIGAHILSALNDLMLTLSKQADANSEAYFKKSTLEDFDTRAEAYKKMKPGLKKDDYNNVFSMAPRRFDLWTEEEYIDIINTIKSQEPIEKWNEELVRLATPVINEWRARIPELKANLQKLKDASDEESRQRIQAEQDRKAAEDKKRRDTELEQQHLDSSAAISAQADLEKMNNEFVAQATVQEVGDTGPTEQVLKFTDKQKMLQALSKIMYHCAIHPDFPGIVKKDKNKKPVLDAQGREEYVPAVQWWIDFFLKNCDAKIEGTTVYEVAKLIIRK